MNKTTARLFAYLIKSNDLSVDVAKEWCFNQYAQEDYPLWIEMVTVDSSKEELLDILAKQYHVYGDIDFEYEVASHCHWYKNGGFSLYGLIQNLLIAVDKTHYSKQNLELLEQSESLFKTDKNAKELVLPMMDNFIEHYTLKYLQTIQAFKETMQLDTFK